ncbi:MAG: hypothetical protein U5N26_06960 [Candidatus Marinimicrobia bacterium]|nr:hypothetical protein [Candidatus Neomarinimicrobiota bacterium]
MEVEVGQVYCVYIDNLGKDKISICVDPPRLGFFYINTKNKKYWDCIPIKKGNYGFLKYDSYISCHNIYRIERHKLTERTYRGDLKEEDISYIYNHILRSDTLTPAQIDNIKRSISSWRRNIHH